MTRADVTRAVVIGAGSWGAAIATALNRASQQTMVLARRQESVDALAMGRCLQLPDSAPASPIAATLDPACLDDAELIFVAVPVVANQASFMMIAERQKNHPPAVVSLCAKGIGKADDGSAMLLTDLASQLLPDHPFGSIFGAKLCR